MSAPGGRVVVIGVGHAGAMFVALLRQAGYRGEIVAFGAEPHTPYHRPPLSKEFLDGSIEQWLRDPHFYAEQDITLRLGERVVEIDRSLGAVRTDAGERLGYDHVVLATGAAPRRLTAPGDDLDGVMVLRTLDDGRELTRRIAGGARVAVVGGGYVGLEVAAAARGRGVETTVLEREDRVLARVASPQLSQILRAHHEERGTRVVTGCSVTGFVGDGGSLTGVVVDGEPVGCDLALVGVGAVPRDELARGSGLECDAGVVVDEYARTSDARVLAIGDVTSRRVLGVDRRMRLESIPNATEQARQAVAAVTAGPAPGPEVPWFWSDQFSLKLKIAGIVHGEFDTAVRGDVAHGRFALFHHRSGRLVAAETANSPADFMAAKRMIAGGVAIDARKLADPDVGLRELTTA